MTGALPNALLRVFGHQQWLRFGLRYNLVKFLSPPERNRAISFSEDFYGLRFDGALDQHIDWHVFFFGAYERSELCLIGDILSAVRAPISADIGANIGHHTMFLSRYSERVHAFEPFAPVRRRLQSHIDANRLENIVVHDIGLSDVDETQEYYLPKGTNWGTGSFVGGGNDQAAQKVRLTVCEGDSYFRDHGIDRLDFIKLDVEGYEGHVLRGLRTTLRAQRPIILMEHNQLSGSSFGGLDDVMAMMPENYEGAWVVPYPTRCWLFHARNYRLDPLGSNARGYNIILFPAEKQPLFARFL